MSNQKSFYQILNEKLSGILGTLSTTYKESAGDISLQDPKVAKCFTVPKYESPLEVITDEFTEYQYSSGYNNKLSFTSDFDGYTIIEFNTNSTVNYNCSFAVIINGINIDERPIRNSNNRCIIPVAEGNLVEAYIYIANTSTSGQVKSFRALKVLSELTSVKLESATPTASGLGVPTGTILSFAGSTVPTGFLFCDGTAISRTDYADLFTVIGTTYGEGDGETTFNLPNLIDKFVEGGSTVGEEKEAGLPNITGQFSIGENDANPNYRYTIIATSGCVSGEVIKGMNSLNHQAGATSAPTLAKIDASKSNAIYGNSTTVQPPALTMKMIIKY